jgi:hypothetical protein
MLFLAQLGVACLACTSLLSFVLPYFLVLSLGAQSPTEGKLALERWQLHLQSLVVHEAF